MLYSAELEAKSIENNITNRKFVETSQNHHSKYKKLQGAAKIRRFVSHFILVSFVKYISCLSQPKAVAWPQLYAQVFACIQGYERLMFVNLKILRNTFFFTGEFHF